MSHDLRLALRSLRATPVVTAVAIGSLALAIGANSAIFSILDSLTLRTLPVSEPQRLVHVTDSVVTETGGVRVRAWSNPFWEQIRRRPDLFESATAWSFVRFDLASGGETQFAGGMWAAGSYFETLGVGPLIGRTFSYRDDRPDGGPDGPVAVISYGCWQVRFGGVADVIGRPVRLNGIAFTVVGVMPPRFFGTEVGRTFDFIVPLGTEALVRGSGSVLDDAASNFLTVMARLKRGQSVDAAGADLRRVQPAIRDATVGPWDKAVADRYLVSPFTVTPAATGYSNLRRSYERPVWIIAAVVALVLLIGCVNVANLLLARAIARRHELSLQIALGASRWRLVRQLFVESLALAVPGAAAGVFVAASVSRFLVQQLSTPASVVRLDTTIDARVLAFTAAVTVLTALLFGTAPAFRAARIAPVDALREKGRTFTDRVHGGMMGWLVVVQVALSVVLVAAAGLFVRSFASLATRDLGLEPDRVLIVAIDPQRALPDPVQRVAAYERIRDAVRRLPNVSSAAVSFLTPAGGGGFTPAVARSGGADAIAADPNSDVFGNLISPGWFDTFGTRLVAGRDFDDRDRRGARPVAIVNDAFVRRFFGGTTPLGSVITVYPNTTRALSMEVVGVVQNAIYTSPRDPAPPTWYAPMAQFTATGFPLESARLSVRAEAGSPALLTKTIAAAVAEVNPQLALTFRPLAGQIHASLTRERLMAQLAGFFGALALLLAAIGLYGVTAYAVSRRRTELGIRLALGAAPAGIIRLILGRMSLLIGAGIAAGCAISVWAATLVAGLIYGLPPRDPATMAGACLVLVVMAALAAWLPARRASRLDPAAVLRE